MRGIDFLYTKDIKSCYYFSHFNFLFILASIHDHFNFLSPLHSVYANVYFSLKKQNYRYFIYFCKIMFFQEQQPRLIFLKVLS